MWMDAMCGGSKLSGTCFNGFKKVQYKDTIKMALCYFDEVGTEWSPSVKGGTLAIRLSHNKGYRATVGYERESE
jgi:hypothetical protein